MKYAIIIPDGASDEPQAALGGKSPLQAAHLPEMDRIAREGVLGLSRNVPDQFVPASDVATLSLLGYDPVRFYTGRAPLEAVAMGIELGPDDWAIRCNLMTILDGRMTDFTAGHITDAEAAELIRVLELHFHPDHPNLEFHPGVSYRNALIYRGRPGEIPFDETTHTTPPHDVPDQLAADHLPSGRGSELLRMLMAEGAEAIRYHAVNGLRSGRGRKPANAVWLWGQGKAPMIPKFADLHRIKGAMVSAVDLVRGVGILAGWDRVDAPGATGYLDTDYASKGRTAIEALKTHDLVCVHVEAPDEASHEGRAGAKVEALERIDSEIVGPLRRALEVQGEWRVLISPDHSTLVRTRSHDRAPVPWAIAGHGFMRDDGTKGDESRAYDEIAAKAGAGPRFDEGWRLMEYYLSQADLNTM